MIIAKFIVSTLKKGHWIKIDIRARSDHFYTMPSKHEVGIITSSWFAITNMNILTLLRNLVRFFLFVFFPAHLPAHSGYRYAHTLKHKAY